MADLLNQLKALADPSRIRILMALSLEPLHVNELLDVLNMGQSRVSRHLRILSDSNLLVWRRDGSRVYYEVEPNLRDQPLWAMINNSKADWSLDLLSLMNGDQLRLHSILESRRARSIVHFEDFGESQDEDQRQYVDAKFYRSQIAELLPKEPGCVLEPGCGAGALSTVLAEKSDRLIVVDQSRTMLRLATEKVGQNKSIEPRVGYIEHLPLADDEVDTVVLSMVLHHSSEPTQALKEAFRVLKPAGQLIIAELDQHTEEVMRRRFEDFWLGFDQNTLGQEIEQVGFQDIEASCGKGDGRLSCLFFSAKKPKSKKLLSKSKTLISSTI
ncbi:MAG: metalloregulator ArsR/SmtB family transcription factor [Leptonema sp. (in: Bacteria)]|nr:metalloregulator ArsR/SmtB family transcription factor [Leptonema sp. (in: bacteria)]